MMEMLSSPRSRVGRALSRPVQLAVIGGVALVLGLLLVLVPIIRDWLAPQAVVEVAAPLPPGAFRPTPQQWAAFKLAPVALHTFRSEEVTDGKIAINDDRTTPVFSPYSGRVVRLFARPGDFVKAGRAARRGRSERVRAGAERPRHRRRAGRQAARAACPRRDQRAAPA